MKAKEKRLFANAVRLSKQWAREAMRYAMQYENICTQSPGAKAADVALLLARDARQKAEQYENRALIIMQGGPI